MDLFDRFLQERTRLKGVSLPCYTNGSDVHFYPFYNSRPIRCLKKDLRLSTRRPSSYYFRSRRGTIHRKNFWLRP